VTVEYFGPFPIWDKKHRRYNTSPVTFAFVLPDRVIVENQELVTEKLSRYSVLGKVFLYTMWAYPCSVDPRSREGGCVGADIMLGFYDENGSGTFQTMEILPTNLSREAARSWQLRIPDWVGRR